jgi:hypothetical protein
MSNEIEKTLIIRGSRYGTFEDNADITQALMAIIEESPKAHELTNLHKECLHMIFHKISRMVCGDPMYVDNVHDIGGYAKGLEDYLIKWNKKHRKN